METFRPRITTQVPEGWLAKESTTLLEPGGEANIIASAEPLDQKMTSEAYAEGLGERLRGEFPGYHEISFGPTPLFEGRSGFLRKFEWAPSEGTPVTQLQVYYAEGGRGYTATATSPTLSFHRFEPVLIDVLRRLTLAS